jgi:hypothetical protein
MFFLPAMIFIIESQSIYSADTSKLSEDNMKVSKDVADLTFNFSIAQNSLDSYQTRDSSAQGVQRM